MAGPWIELELTAADGTDDRAAAIVATLREQGMKLRGDGPIWHTDVETDDLEVARETVAGALESADERWEEVLTVGPARG